MTQRPHVAVWFEIPATDFDRAVQFYETVLDVGLRREAMGSQTLGVFPYVDGASSGCILASPDARPASGGTTVYLNADGRLDAAIRRVEAAGGRQLTPVIDLPPGMGRFVHILDSEGNRVGLHATT